MAADDHGLQVARFRNAAWFVRRGQRQVRVPPRQGRRIRNHIDYKEAMIAKLIRWSIANRFLVLLATAMLTLWGIGSVLRTPLDAIPDLSDVQVIIRTTFPGQAPQIV